MKPLMPLAALALISAALGPLSGCAVRGSSFQTLGVPTPEARAGRSPVILGWALEDRSGWVLKQVRIDEQTRHEWNEETQEPTIFYLEPGEHEVRLSTAQLADARDLNSRARRRYRVRPFQLDLLEGVAQLCVIRLRGDERVRPRVSCEVYDTGGAEEEDEYEDEDEYGDEYDEEPAATAEAPPAPPPSGADQPFASLSVEEEEAEEAPAQTATPAEDQSEGAASEESEDVVPSPFGPIDPPATATPATATPAAAEPSGAVSPRRLTLEARVERLERMVQTLVRELRARQR